MKSSVLTEGRPGTPGRFFCINTLQTIMGRHFKTTSAKTIVHDPISSGENPDPTIREPESCSDQDGLHVELLQEMDREPPQILQNRVWNPDLLCLFFS